MAVAKRPKQTKHNLKKSAVRAVGKGETLYGYFGRGEDPLFRDARKKKFAEMTSETGSSVTLTPNPLE